MISQKARTGGSFVQAGFIPAQELFVPEDITDEQEMIADLTEKFVANDVRPALEQIENQDFDCAVKLLRKAGELGLLGADVPEEYGGMDLDKVSSALITEKIALGRSFAITLSGQVGIGSLPIVYFGTKEQKEKYLPDIITAEKIGAYALTEPTAGTDALSAKTTATLSECGNYYIINGEKQFITNSAFADIFIVFAKIDGDKFTAFIVEKEYEGVSTGPEEKKMGLKGSSTRSLILDNVKVPLENVLGEIGKGHHIAFNILNIGRHKIAAQCVGLSKHALELATKYANERKQFGQPLSSFPLIQTKIAEMAMLTYVNESMVYRTSGLFDRSFENKHEEGFSPTGAIREFAIECSINKVFSTEAYDAIIDEALQIHGGYGYIAEYEVETLYRDSRINRIFEGTNEINRVVIATTLLKKFDFAAIEEERADYRNEFLGAQKQVLAELKLLFVKVARTVQTSKLDVNADQEIVAFLSDLAIEIYAIESALIRAEKLVEKNGEEKEIHKINCAILYTNEAAATIANKALQTLPYLQQEELLEAAKNIFSLNFSNSSTNMVSLKRTLATHVIKQEKYAL